MSTVFDKLNFKDQREILVLNAPKSFDKEILSPRDVRVRRRMQDVQKLVFALVFVTAQLEAERFAAAIAAKTAGDVVLWFAYPKGASKRGALRSARPDQTEHRRRAPSSSVASSFAKLRRIRPRSVPSE